MTDLFVSLSFISTLRTVLSAMTVYTSLRTGLALSLASLQLFRFSFLFSSPFFFDLCKEMCKACREFFSAFSLLVLFAYLQCGSFPFFIWVSLPFLVYRKGLVHCRVSSAVSLVFFIGPLLGLLNFLFTVAVLFDVFVFSLSYKRKDTRQSK